MVRIAFVINFSKKSWTGGFIFFENLIYFLIKHKKKIKISIITNNKKNLKNFKYLNKIETLETNLVSHNINLKRIFDKFLIFFLGKSFFLEKFLIKNNINIISHYTYCGYKSRIKSFPWFPDFQHINFPQNFSYKNKFFRNLNVKLSEKNSNGIILSSQSVKKDINKISKLAYKKSFVLHHANRVLDRKNLYKLSFLKKKYDIKKQYFLLPNHYWVHKNHFVVLKALKYLSKQNFEILSTGLQHDHRDRNHIKRIKNYIKENNLENKYKILDLVPFKDLCSLMKYSIAVINPSFSEGWGNSGDQAKLLGKPCILSKIPVHKEFKYKHAYYFNPKNYKELGILLKKIKKKIFL